MPKLTGLARLAGLAARVAGSIRALAGQIGPRLVVVNLVVLLVPLAGIEFARLYERRLLDSLERDMHHQAVAVAELMRLDLTRGYGLEDPTHEPALIRIAEVTRARIRVLARDGSTVVDSHAHGAPEGPEPVVRASSSWLDRGVATETTRAGRLVDAGQPWADVPHRSEVIAALRGTSKATFTRVRERAPAVMLFLAVPIRGAGGVIGAVYVVRSTQPVLDDLHRIRRGLARVLVLALFTTGLVTLVLALSISRPLSKLSRAARRIAAGERNVPVPVEGTGEVHELATAFATMTARLEERLGYARDLAADVAHEFKSPLTSIRGAAELLAEGAADDPVARARFLRNIGLDVERLDRLVSRLLELGRLEASTELPTPVDLAAAARAEATRATTPDVNVTVEVAAGETFVSARAADISAAMHNVIENAVRFSPPGGSVAVRVRPSDTQVDVEVSDHGPGIAAANLEKIFDRFFTTDAERSGTGLGLAIVRAVMRAHAGEVSVQSTPGEGTTFTLRFPRGGCTRGGRDS